MTEENGHERNSKGLFLPGNKASSNRGPNKISTKVKDSLAKFLDDNIDKVQESFDQLKPLEKLQFIANILPYIVPKLSSTQSENNTKLSGGLAIRWINPREHAALRPARYEGHEREPMGLRGGVSDNSEPRGDEVG
jgi:hypothetical protein